MGCVNSNPAERMKWEKGIIFLTRRLLLSIMGKKYSNPKDADGDSSPVGESQRAGEGARPVSVAQEAKIPPESQTEGAAGANRRSGRHLVSHAGFHRYMEAYVSMVIGGTTKYVSAFVLISGDEGLVFSLSEHAARPDGRVPA